MLCKKKQLHSSWKGKLFGTTCNLKTHWSTLHLVYFWFCLLNLQMLNTKFVLHCDLSLSLLSYNTSSFTNFQKEKEWSQFLWIPPFEIPAALVFYLKVSYKVDRLLIGLTAQQFGTTARWYSNKTPQLNNVLILQFYKFIK